MPRVRPFRHIAAGAIAWIMLIGATAQSRYSPGVMIHGWLVASDATGCSALATYKNGNELYLSDEPATDTANVMVMGPSFAFATPGVKYSATITFLKADGSRFDWPPGRALGMNLYKGRHGLQMRFKSSQLLPDFATATKIGIMHDSELIAAFDLPYINNVLAELRSCVATIR